MTRDLGDRCRLELPLTWVFAGDPLTIPGQPLTRGSSPGSFLIDSLRDFQQRSSDVFVFAESPGFFLETCRAKVIGCVERFSPDILILTCGVRELLEATGTALAFEAMFFELTEAIRRPGRTIALNLPPYFPFQSLAEATATNALIRLEALRACSREADVAVIDHWAWWEEEAEPDWYQLDGQTPSPRGCLEMARLMICELGLDPCPEDLNIDGAAIPESLIPEYAHGSGDR